MDKNVILKSVLTEFEGLAKIPRPSGHEKQVSDYLAARLRRMGLKVIQDEYNNIIADKKAAAGFEHKPLILLQGHMDMVCIAEAGVDYDPLHDSIKIHNDGKFLSAAGTSLGADDGMGIAIILYVLAQDFVHGPLRVIFTVDEEQSMTGARGLDKKYLDNVKYLINCDSEDYDMVTVGSAGNVRIAMEKQVVWNKPQGNCALHIGIKHLLGGHSGTEIGRNRCNAIKILGFILENLMEKNIQFSLADMNGGTADNAIAAQASVKIVCDAADRPAIEQTLSQMKQGFQEIYGATEKNAVFVFEQTELPDKVIDGKSTEALIALLCMVHSGVYAMSEKTAQLPKLSSNIGRMNIADDKITVHVLSRSATNASLAFIKTAQRLSAECSGFKAVLSPTSPAWNGDPDSKLVKLAGQVFTEQNGRPMKVEFIHGGLECNYFADKNNVIDIISIGPTNIDIHTPQERLQLDTVVPQVLLVQTLIGRLAAEGK
ncbi:beta-Ala-His dipeptidase [Pectinatus frisingensis]|uniref:beta-Ala-His dipeptidase n=1 Tax=Pectinatus frisingensis TaxID=865 RepID=UPI0015F636D6|nr:beta-Ala-His dipeptidase [Pectinatus frisingensis]